MGEQGLALVMVALVLLIMEVLVPGEPTWRGRKEGRRGAGWGGGKEGKEEGDRSRHDSGRELMCSSEGLGPGRGIYTWLLSSPQLFTFEGLIGKAMSPGCECTTKTGVEADSWGRGSAGQTGWLRAFTGGDTGRVD